MTLLSIIKCRLNSKHDTAEYHQMQAQQQTRHYRVSSNAGSAANKTLQSIISNAGPTANMTLQSIIKCRLSSKQDTAEYHQMQAQQQTRHCRVSSNAGPTANKTLQSIIKCRLSSKQDTAEYHQMQAQQQT